MLMEVDIKTTTQIARYKATSKPKRKPRELMRDQLR